MDNGKRQFERYEDVARYLLEQFREHFGLHHVEPKQVLPGNITGTSWEVDGKGVRLESGEGIVVVECRRYETARIKQEAVAGLAFRILDLGATGGILVSPLGFQEGAKQVAAATGIIEVRLNAESTTENYVLGFLDRVMIQVTERLVIRDTLKIIKKDASGRIIEELEY